MSAFYYTLSGFELMLATAFDPLTVLIYTNFGLWLTYSYNTNIFPLILLIIISAITFIIICLYYISYGNPIYDDLTQSDLKDMYLQFIILFKILIYVIFIYTLVVKNEQKLPLIILMLILYIYTVLTNYIYVKLHKY